MKPETGRRPGDPGPAAGCRRRSSSAFDTTYPGTLADKDDQTTGFRSHPAQQAGPDGRASTPTTSRCSTSAPTAPGTLAVDLERPTAATPTAPTAPRDNTLVNGLRLPFDASGGTVHGQRPGARIGDDAGRRQRAGGHPVRPGPGQLRQGRRDQPGRRAEHRVLLRARRRRSDHRHRRGDPDAGSRHRARPGADRRPVSGHGHMPPTGSTTVPGRCCRRPTRCRPHRSGSSSASRLRPESWCRTRVGRQFVATFDSFADQRRRHHRGRTGPRARCTAWTSPVPATTPTPRQRLDPGHRPVQPGHRGQRGCDHHTAGDRRHRRRRAVPDLPRQRRQRGPGPAGAELRRCRPRAPPRSTCGCTSPSGQSGNNAVGRRVFDIGVEGTTVRTGFDIFAAAGGVNTATVLPINNVTVDRRTAEPDLQGRGGLPVHRRDRGAVPGHLPGRTRPLRHAPTGLAATAQRDRSRARLGGQHGDRPDRATTSTARPPRPVRSPS